MPQLRQPRPTRIQVEYEDGSLDSIEFSHGDGSPLCEFKRKSPGVNSRSLGAFTHVGVADILSRTIRGFQRI